MRIKYRFSRFFAFLSPIFLWRKIYLHRSYQESLSPEEDFRFAMRCARYAELGVRIRVLPYPEILKRRAV